VYFWQRQTFTMAPKRGAKKFDREMKFAVGRQTLTMAPNCGAVATKLNIRQR